jgi:hypothetical protein
MLKARDRLDFKFEPKRHFKDNYNAIARVRVPLNREVLLENAPVESKKNIEPEENKLEESFIEPYDGTSFEKDRVTYRGKFDSFII